MEVGLHKFQKETLSTSDFFDPEKVRTKLKSGVETAWRHFESLEKKKRGKIYIE